MAERKFHLNKLDVLSSSAQDCSQSDEDLLSVLKVTLFQLASVCYADSESQISAVIVGKSRKRDLKNRDAAVFPPDAVAVSLKTFPVDANKMIKKIEMMKITPKKISQDLKDFNQDVSLERKMIQE